MKNLLLCNKLRWIQGCLCFSLFFCIALFMWTRSTFTDVNGVDAHRMEDAPYVAYELQDETLNWYTSTEDKTLENMFTTLKKAPFVVKAQISGSRVWAYNSRITEIVIHEVLRGDNLAEGDTLKLIEPVSPMRRVSSGELDWHNTQRLHSNAEFAMRPIDEPYLNGMSPLSKKQEYLLFLQPVELREKDGKNNKDCYVAYMQTLFSCINLTQNRVLVLARDKATTSDSGVWLSKEECALYSCVVDDEQTLTHYQELRKQVLAEYKVIDSATE
ncbi:hypothetical protein KPC83_03375 [Collinsella sp. zg1085]|uniref:hypothetical protein n=1 Tax=Collinsella sp. zg1085 TaxID=2844380 RepID=UPI001C0C8641|nr:hypothetical protein [Collinsella sp. zg1085]QWT18184.1 hypothetical protein KPC83_03375 [Collinsella sp. zg1085]